ncbi:hypothetical protein EMIT0111MI5_230084 [Burkholderia sp. IT-111MI5]
MLAGADRGLRLDDAGAVDSGAVCDRRGTPSEPTERCVRQVPQLRLTHRLPWAGSRFPASPAKFG